MSPEALARLREVVRRYQSDLSFSPEFQDVEHDLRALLDAYDTARADGVADERARVVAWLLETRDGAPDWQEETHTLLTCLAHHFKVGDHDKEGA